MKCIKQKIMKRKAVYKINFYELDCPIAINFTGNWPAIIDGDKITLNPHENGAILLRATVLEISHKKLGKLKGLYTKGLDYTIVLEDGTQLLMEAEETPGLIYDHNEFISPEEFNVVLWSPQITDIPFGHCHAGLDSLERKMIREHRDKQMIEKLGMDK